MEVTSEPQTANIPEELITAQGACPAGVKPEGNEIISWNFCAFLREAIFSFPQGAMLEEYDAWITGIHDLWQEDTRHISEPTSNLGELPVLIFEFLKRITAYKQDGIPFDLVKVFTYIYQPDGPIIYDDLELSIDEEGRIDMPHRRWLGMTVDTFNAVRAREGRERLKLDSTPYFGRITATRLREMLASGKTIFQFQGAACPPKLPIIPSRMERQPTEGSTNEEPELQEAISEDVEMEMEQKAVEGSGEKRYSLRRKTVEKRATRQPPPTAPMKQQTPGIRARTQTKGKKPMRAAEIPQITLTSADEDSELVRQVHCATRPEYWIEEKGRLPDTYWLDVEIHPDINELQIALISCYSCTINNRPCMIYLRISPGCVSCIDSGHSCSFVPFIGDGKTHVHVPYSVVLGKIFHCKQISLWMQGSPMEIQPRRIEHIHFGQGMPHGVKTHNFTKDGLAEEKRRAKLALKEIEEDVWQLIWFGLPYRDAERAHRLLMSKDPEEVALVDCAQWDIMDGLTEKDLEYVDKYYEALKRAWSQENFCAYDMLQLPPLSPHIPPLLPSGQNPELKGPPQSYGLTREKWVEERQRELGLLEGTPTNDDIESELEEVEEGGDAHDEDDDVEEAEQLEDATPSTSGDHTEEEIDQIVEDEEERQDEELGGAQEPPVVIERRTSSSKASVYDMPLSIEAQELSEDEAMEVDELLPSHFKAPKKGVVSRMRRNVRNMSPPPSSTLRAEGSMLTGGPSDDASTTSGQEIGGSLVEGSPQTPRRGTAPIDFLSPIQRELERPGSTLTRASAEQINAGMRTRLTELNTRLAVLEEQAAQQSSKEMVDLVHETRRWFDDAKATIPDAIEAMNVLTREHDALRTELQRTVAQFEEYRDKSESRLREAIKHQLQALLSGAEGVHLTELLPQSSGAQLEQAALSPIPEEQEASSSSDVRMASPSPPTRAVFFSPPPPPRVALSTLRRGTSAPPTAGLAHLAISSTDNEDPRITIQYQPLPSLSTVIAETTTNVPPTVDAPVVLPTSEGEENVTSEQESDVAERSSAGQEDTSGGEDMDISVGSIP